MPFWRKPSETPLTSEEQAAKLHEKKAEGLADGPTGLDSTDRLSEERRPGTRGDVSRRNSPI